MSNDRVILSGNGINYLPAFRRWFLIGEVTMVMLIIILFAGEYFFFSGKVTIGEIVFVSILLLGSWFLASRITKKSISTMSYEFTDIFFIYRQVVFGSQVEIKVPIEDIKYFCFSSNIYSIVTKLKMLELKTIGDDFSYFIKGNRDLYKRNSVYADFYCLLSPSEAEQAQNFLIKNGVPLATGKKLYQSLHEENKNRFVLIASKFGLLFSVFLLLGLAESLFLGTFYALTICMFFGSLFFLFSAIGGLIDRRIVIDLYGVTGPLPMEGNWAILIGLCFFTVSIFTFWIFIRMILFIF